MKNKSIINLLLLFVGVGFAASCSDMLTPDMERYAEKSGQDTLYSYLGILKSMQNIAERYVVLGESRGDLVTSSTYTNDSVGRLFNFENPEDGESAFLRIADYYKVINGCNFYLRYADTASLKNNIYYMRKEYAQVQAMRAWTYMQLVQNYGSVPFITEPVSNTNEGLSLERNAPRATAANLVDLLEEAGLSRAAELQEEYGYPNYLTYSTGSGSVPSRSCFYPVPLVEADLYLLKGDYEMAATKYYDFLQDAAPYVPRSAASWTEREQDGQKYYVLNSASWRNRFKNYTVSQNSNDLVVVIPGASNSYFGTVLTGVQNVYGFKTSSSNETTNNRREDETISTDDETITTTGAISVSPDPTYLQLTPSESYIGLNQAQDYCSYGTSSSGDDVIEYYNAGDTRLDASAARYRSLVNNNLVTNRFIQKFCTGSNSYDSRAHINYGGGYSIYYGVQVYRKAAVYLRFAEAINRAGFPEYAFAVLKDGLSTENLPYYTERAADSLRYNIGEAGDTTSIDTVAYTQRILRAPEAESGGAYYIDIDEAQRAQTKSYLNFNDAAFNNENVYGVHSLGCGDTRGYHDTLFTFDKAVARKLLATEAEANQWDELTLTVRANQLAAQGVMNLVKAGTYTQDDVINAVEDLILDEMALETAFEGNRYPDLLRFAAHKGGGTIDNEWLAKKIARRGYGPYQYGYDAALYNKLVGGNLWYLSLPNE